MCLHADSDTDETFMQIQDVFFLEHTAQGINS